MLTPDWTPPNAEFAQAVTTAVLTMPAAMHLEFQFRRVTAGTVEIVQPYRKELTQHDGYIQGGVFGALVDFAGGAAAGTLLPTGWVNATIDYTVKILAPAAETVVARGRVIKPGRTTTIAAADITTSEGGHETLCATGLVTLRNIHLGARRSSGSR